MMSGRDTTLRALAALATLLLLPGSEPSAAPADVPARLTYQGVLLDEQGQPRTGPVALVVRIYDTAAGGTLLYKQSFNGTPLSAGTFTLLVGPTGAASDSPDDPLTTSLAAVFAGDLVAGPNRFFELSVAGDPALGRIQILSAPLAIRADSAAHADSADSATSAQSVTSIDGIDPVFVSQIFEHVNYDGSGPPNGDPSEGVVDTDGDGRANFIDSDNDDDGLSDTLDAAAGGDINLATPTITTLSPTSANSFQTLPVTINGTNFVAGMAVAFGSQSPVPSDITPTSLSVVVGPQLVGSSNVTVTRPNGQSWTKTNAFSWNAIAGEPHLIGAVRLNTFAIRNDDDPLLGRLNDDYQVDVNGDGFAEVPFNANGVGQAAYTFNPSGRIRGVICTVSGLVCTVRTMNDHDGNDIPEQQLAIETFTAGTQVSLRSASVAVTATREVRAYVRGRTDATLAADVVVAVDYNGDGDWNDASERAVLEAGASDATVAAAVKSDGTPVVMYDRDPSGGGELRLSVDLSGDGDFADTVGGVPEVRAIGLPGTSCYDVAVDGANRLAVVYQQTGAPGVTVLHDRNGDGDFSGAGEIQGFGDGAADLCRISRAGATGIAVATEIGTVMMRIDRNDDGDFDDLLETTNVTTATSALGLAANAAGEVFLATASEIYPGL
jgi:hypothetical protein